MVLISLLALILASGPGADDTDFSRFAAPAPYVGPRGRLHLGADARSHRFRSALTEAYDGEVDFAGRYVMGEFGCGAGCIRVAVIDARTGAVHWFPFSISSWPKAYLDPLEYRTGSRLLIVHGRLDERGDDGPHAFAFYGRSFRPE